MCSTNWTLEVDLLPHAEVPLGYGQIYKRSPLVHPNHKQYEVTIGNFPACLKHWLYHNNGKFIGQVGEMDALQTLLLHFVGCNYGQKKDIIHFLT